MTGSLAALCLATAIYFEGRGEPMRGQEAIAEVVINRSIQSEDTVCKTVARSGQFMQYWKPQWWSPIDPQAWNESLLLAKRIVSGAIHTNYTHGALFFSRGLPDWATKEIRIGRHWFYKEKRK